MTVTPNGFKRKLSGSRYDVGAFRHKSVSSVSPGSLSHKTSFLVVSNLALALQTGSMIAHSLQVNLLLNGRSHIV